MTNILGKQTVVMVPGELGIRLSSQTGSENHYSKLSFIHRSYQAIFLASVI
jgi:hypothetical protein